MHEHGRSLLLRIAGGGTLRLAEGEAALLAELGEAGLVHRVDTAPRQADLQARYEALQETHRRFQEAKGCLERLERRLAPRSRLGGLLPAGKPLAPTERDPDLLRLHELLQALDIRVPGVAEPKDLPGRLEKLRDRLLVDSRSCLDRLALVDRELDALQKAPAPGTQVDALGCFALTGAGERALPEAGAMEDLEAAFHAVAGSNRHRIDDYGLFRDDPANLLAFILEGQARGDRPSRVVSEFEALADAFEHMAPFTDVRSMRVKNAFLMRLVRATPGQPQAPYLWCNRERLQGLLARMADLAPASVVSSRWHLLYAADLLIAGSGNALPLQEDERRLLVFEAVQRRLIDQLQGIDVGDGQFLRLTIALLHEVLPRNFTNPLLLDRAVAQMVEAAFDGMVHAPADLAGAGTRLLFGYHLAHLARFVRARVDAAAQAYSRVEAPFTDGNGRLAPVQVVLHALVALERCAQGGLAVAPEEYAGTFLRLRRRIQQHKGLARAFDGEQVMAEDEPFLAANLTARAYALQAARMGGGTAARRLPDVGLAGLYEPQDRRGAPLLGLPFGTLMLS